MKIINTDVNGGSCDIVNKYCAYYRVSTTRQGHSGLGLEAQRGSVEHYIRTHGGTIEQDFIEVESGKRNQRPKLIEAIEYCRRHKATLLIAKLDRLSRNLHFITGLMEAKIDFVACDNPHATKMMIQMLAVFAEHEREMISERTKQALRAAKARGVKLGANGQNLARKNKTRAIEFARKLEPVIQDIQNSGHKTYQAIADELNKRGVQSEQGGQFYPASAYRLIKRLETI
jgi:DNA invertase Pin-like site-specific DNA recombinase